MMKLSGHTMGTPEYTLEDAIRLFKGIGLDGVEIIVQNGYRCAIAEDADATRLQEIKCLVGSLGMEVSCLTPYFSKFNSLDESVRRREVEGLRKVIDQAFFLGAKFVRVYGGNYKGNEMDPTGEKRANLVDSMRFLGKEAEQAGVKLVIENHFNTMAVSASESISLAKEIDSPAVGILYDQANLTFTNKEDYSEALNLQMEKVFYVHVKDFVFKGADHTFKSEEVSHPKETERNVVTKIVGEGCVPWPKILKRLKKEGYDGWLSLEYERRWHPDDIPDACIGMKASASYVKACLKNI